MDGFFWIVAVCTALSGYFALAGASLRIFRRARIEEAFGGKDARRLAMLERHLPALQLTCALGWSLANVILAVAMVYLLQAGLEWSRALWAVAVAGALIAVFGVAIPSAWASYGGEKVVAVTFWPLMACRLALYPLVAVLLAFEKPMRRLSGVPEQQMPPAEAARQEILLAASEGQAEGSLAPQEARMIESVIEFGDRRAGEIMTPRTDIYALPASLTWTDACKKVAESGHSRLPVYEGDIDNITGILYAKDLLSHVGRDAPTSLTKLQRKPFFVPQTKLLDDLLLEFKARKVHIAVVLDEYGGTAGLVTIEDVLEEIVGEIADEFDLPEPALMRRIDDRTAEADGRMSIDDLNDAMGLSLPQDEDYETIAGYVFSELGYIPAVGETLEGGGARISVLAADARRITRLKIEKQPQAQHRASED